MHYICLLYMMIIHDEILTQITICNDNNKFVEYSHKILQKFTVNDRVMVIIHFERFSPGTVWKFHARCIGSYRVLRMIASITHELNIL